MLPARFRFASTSAAVWMAAMSAAWPDVALADKIPTEEPKPSVVIKLEVKPDSKAPFDVGEEGPPATAADKEQAVKLFGRHAAEQMAKQMDFDKQQAVRIRWTTGGPPFGVLQHSEEETKDGVKIVFFVREPDSPVRGRALKLGLDFFAVPKGAKVSFRQWRPGPGTGGRRLEIAFVLFGKPLTYARAPENIKPGPAACAGATSWRGKRKP